MLPLAADIRAGKIYSLTDAGRDASKQLSIDASAEDDIPEQVIADAGRASAFRGAHQEKIPLADKILKSLERKGWIAVEQVQHERDPLRAPAAKLRIALTACEPARQTAQSRARTAGVSLAASGLAQSGRTGRHQVNNASHGRALAGAQAIRHADAGAAGHPQRTHRARRMN